MEPSEQEDEVRVGLRPIPAERIDSVRELWLELAEHHWRCAPQIAALAPRLSAEASWAARREQYQGWAGEPGWLLLGADLEGQLLGYAAARITSVASSWDLGRYAGRLETLTVRGGDRERGIGRRLFGHVQSHWRDRGVGYGSVSVIAGNAGAARFYERHGAVQYSRTSYFRVAP